MPRRWTPRRSSRVVIGLVASLAVLLPLGWLWAGSLVPETYSVMGMGYHDYGGGPGDAGHGVHTAALNGPDPQPGDVSVADLTGPRNEAPDEAVTLTARAETITLATGETVEGYTLNHSSPGPTIRVREGELLEVRLVNESVEDGTALHWHGVDLPNAEDGVPGVTQDAVPPGGEHVHRFVAEEPGSYWYHSHQVSSRQVRGGLFGVLVVEPADGTDELDVVAAVHTYGGVRTVNGATGEQRVDASAGAAVRVRVVNTDNGPLDVSMAGAAYRVLAIDARDINEPTPVSGRSLQLPAGGRADLGFTTPADGSAVRVQLGAGGLTDLVVGPDGAPAPEPVEPSGELDLLSYGSPAPLGFDPDAIDRRFKYSIGRRPGFVDGMPGMYWSVNGHLYPDLPSYMVAEGDVVRVTLDNHSGMLHPMHLHGHHAVVLSRNGEPATGSPWWIDSIDVDDGDTYEIALVADNPGIWMYHCHNLDHAADGFVLHLGYIGVYTPYLIGGPAGNQPDFQPRM